MTRVISTERRQERQSIPIHREEILH